jgi:hypothetical protein
MAGVWLIGLGVLFATRFWWPGIMFLIGIAAIVQGLGEENGRSRIRGGLLAIFIGVWAALRFNVAFLLIAMGVMVILRSLPQATCATKPYYDSRLD